MNKKLLKYSQLSINFNTPKDTPYTCTLNLNNYKDAGLNGERWSKATRRSL